MHHIYNAIYKMVKVFLKTVVLKLYKTLQSSKLCGNYLQHTKVTKNKQFNLRYQVSVNLLTR